MSGNGNGNGKAVASTADPHASWRTIIPRSSTR